MAKWTVVEHPGIPSGPDHVVEADSLSVKDGCLVFTNFCDVPPGVAVEVFAPGRWLAAMELHPEPLPSCDWRGYLRRNHEDAFGGRTEDYAMMLILRAIDRKKAFPNSEALREEDRRIAIEISKSQLDEARARLKYAEIDLESACASGIPE